MLGAVVQQELEGCILFGPALGGENGEIKEVKFYTDRKLT